MSCMSSLDGPEVLHNFFLKGRLKILLFSSDFRFRTWQTGLFLYVDVSSYVHLFYRMEVGRMVGA